VARRAGIDEVVAEALPEEKVEKVRALQAAGLLSGKIGGASISFPNRAAGEVDFYGGWRPTFGPVAFDFGAWYYYYPGGQCFNALDPSCVAGGGFPINLPNGNVIKKDLSFYEIYGKVNYTVNDNIVLGAYVYYSPSVLNSGADGVFFAFVTGRVAVALIQDLAVTSQQEDRGRRTRRFAETRCSWWAVASSPERR
jgi:hypothetical protein